MAKSTWISSRGVYLVNWFVYLNNYTRVLRNKFCISPERYRIIFLEHLFEFYDVIPLEWSDLCFVGMSKSHAETILERLHDQYLRGLDCDVILRAADHLAQSTPESPNVNSSLKFVWESLSCHKNVLRAASSFFDRIFSHDITFEKLEVDEGVECVLVENTTDKQASLQVSLHNISLHSLQVLVNFAYSGNVAIETCVLARVIEDFKVMNLRVIMDKLEARLQENLCFQNCIPNLIISFHLGKEDKHREIMGFILREFFKGLKNVQNDEETWRNHLTSDQPQSKMVENVICELKKEGCEAGNLGLADLKHLVSVVVKLIEKSCISEEDEMKLSAFLITKSREKCGLHLQSIVLFCYTDDQELCIDCLTNGHEKHLIKSVRVAKFDRLAPYWEKIILELEALKDNTRDRINHLDNLTNYISTEKLRDTEILNHCAELKPKLDSLSIIFKSGKLDSVNNDVLAVERFVAALLKETRRSKGDYEKAQSLSEKLMDLMQRRCASCASIADATLEIETLEDMQEIDIDQPLSTSNCISILKRSKKLDSQQIYNKAFVFLLRNFIDIVKKSDGSFYRRISPSVLESLLKSDKLNVESEEDVIPIVKEWLEFDYRTRNRFATQLLKQIRLGCVSKRVLKEIEADPSHSFMLNVESKLLLQNVIRGDCDRNFRECMAVKVLAFGSDGQNLLFDFVRDTWDEWKGQDNSRFFGAAKVMDNIFIVGGETRGGHHLSKVTIYNARTKSWHCGPNMLEARCVFGTCVSSTNTIYVVGGLGLHAMNSAEMLNCDQNGEPVGSWQRLPPMKYTRRNFEIAIVDDKIYAIGGLSDLTTMEVFDPKTNSWKDCRSKSQGCHNHAVSTHNGEIYVFSIDGFCEKYNPATDTWTNIATLNDANISVCLRGCADLNGKIYLIGGYNCTKTDIYDVEKNTWSKGPPMPKEIGWTKCVSFQ